MGKLSNAFVTKNMPIAKYWWMQLTFIIHKVIVEILEAMGEIENEKQTLAWDEWMLHTGG